MKKKLIISVSALLAMTAMAGCQQEEQITAPALTPAVNELTVESAGGVCEVAYQIENPVQGAVLQPSSNADEWIVNYDTSVDGVLAFEVLPNTSDGEITRSREGVVTVVYTYPSGASSFSVKISQKGSNLTPQLELVSDPEMSVLSNARQHTVHFSLTDEVDGGSLQVRSDSDWITIDEESMAADSVNFQVTVNTADQERQGNVIIEYIWPDGQRTVEVGVTQASGYITFDAPMLQGYYYGRSQSDAVNYQYFFYLTDNGFDEYGYAYPNSVYFNIDLRLGEAPSNLYQLEIPAGTYDFLERADEFPAGVFTTQNGYIVNGEVYVEDNVAFSSGTMTVERNGSTHNVTVDLELADGRKAHVTFSGEPSFINSSGEMPTFTGGTQLTPTECIARLYTAPDGGERDAGGYTVWFDFFDSKNKADGTPADVITVYTFLDADEDYNVAIPDGGILPVVDQTANVGPGYVVSGFTADYAGTFSAGTYVTRYDAQGRPFYAFVADGEMEMSVDEDGIYTFELRFKDSNGDDITGTYTGPVRMAGRPQLSTISADMEPMDLSAVTSGIAEYNGGSMWEEAAGNWQIELLPEYGEAGDGMTIEICTGVSSEDLSSIVGTYTADITGAAGTFVIGQWNVMRRHSLPLDALQGTGYIGDFSEDGLACSLAPAMDGTVTISRNQDGTFTITMENMIDDHDPAYSFSGTWTGSLSKGTCSGNQDEGFNLYAPPVPQNAPEQGSHTGLSTMVGGTGSVYGWKL